MAACRNRTYWRRGTLLGVTLLLVVAHVVKQRRAAPRVAPVAVSREGCRLLSAELRALTGSDFLASFRGITLALRIQQLLEQEHIQFSASLGTRRGITVMQPLHGEPRVILKVMAMADGRYLQQAEWQLVGVAFHEALHLVAGGRHAASLEEECDAFLAGLQAEAASKGEPFPERVRVDGKTLADFVRQVYPRIKRDASYQPVGADRDWLLRHAGLTE